MKYIDRQTNIQQHKVISSLCAVFELDAAAICAKWMKLEEHAKAACQTDACMCVCVCAFGMSTNPSRDPVYYPVGRPDRDFFLSLFLLARR